MTEKNLNDPLFLFRSMASFFSFYFSTDGCSAVRPVNIREMPYRQE